MGWVCCHEKERVYQYPEDDVDDGDDDEGNG